MIKSLTQELLQKAQVLETSPRVSESRQKSAKWEFSENLRFLATNSPLGGRWGWLGSPSWIPFSSQQIVLILPCYSELYAIWVFLLMQAVPLDPSFHSNAVQRSWDGY
jgi:hypothetical protein